jgi:hypothetical protein
MVSPVKDAAWMAWVERLVAAAPLELPPARFHCLLDDQPNHLTPMGSWRQEWEHLAGRRLFLHPRCWITEGEVPAEIPHDVPHLDKFALQGKIIWLQDPASNMIDPFWLGDKFASALEGVRPGDAAPDSLPAEVTQTLFAARVLVTEDFFSDRKQQWARLLLHNGVEYRQKNYTPVRGLLHPFHVAALRRYYRHLVRKGGLRFGDEQTSRRFVAHNEPVAQFFHHQLTGLVSGIAGEPVKPSYVYFGAYQGGAVLTKHTDRAQCEFSVTFCLDYSPEPKLETPWPIELHPASGKVTVFQALGDALFYRGCKVPHSRERLPSGHSSTSIFFHYVREDFGGELD